MVLKPPSVFTASNCCWVGLSKNNLYPFTSTDIGTPSSSTGISIATIELLSALSDGAKDATKGRLATAMPPNATATNPTNNNLRLSMFPCANEPVE